jgi:hypothetical protein
MLCTTFGNQNVAIGSYALCTNTYGNHNIAVGYGALRAKPGDVCHNIGIGYRAAEGTVGKENIAIGKCALQSYGNKYNIAIGACANRYLGGYSYTIAIGHDASTSTNYNNHTVWGGSINSTCNCIYVAWSVVSDCRDKTNIKALPDGLGLSFIKKIKPVTYNWDHRDKYVKECGFEYGTKDGSLSGVREHYGVIAQDVKAAIDELGVKFDALGHDKEKDAYRVTYEELIAPLIKAVQELDQRLEVVEEKLGITK